MPCEGERELTITGPSRDYHNAEGTCGAPDTKVGVNGEDVQAPMEPKSGEKDAASAQRQPSLSPNRAPVLPEPAFLHHKTRDRVRRAKKQHR